MDAILSTKNSDYLVKNSVCEAVRARGQDGWFLSHKALGQRLLGGIDTDAKFHFNQVVSAGMRLVFENDVFTSPVVSVKPV